MNDITFLVEDSRNLQNQLSPLIFLSSNRSPRLGDERAEVGVGTLLFSSRIDWIICR